MIIETYSLRAARTNPTANISVTSFASRVPTTTAPSGDGIVEFGGIHGSAAPQWLLLVPYGVGADTATFSMNVWGWVNTGEPSSGSSLWIPVLLAGFTSCTLSSGLPGIVNSDLGTTTYFCRSITLSIGTPASGSDVAVVSPGAGYIAHARVLAKGFRFLEVGYATGGSAASANALYMKL